MLSILYIYCTYRALIQKYIDDIMHAAAYASGTGYFIDIITTYHKHIRTCIAMLPHHMRAIEHHEAYIHHGDDNRRMTIREQMLQPTLRYSLHNIDNDKHIQAYHDTWCQTDYFCRIINDNCIKFLPLLFDANLQLDQNPRRSL